MPRRQERIRQERLPAALWRLKPARMNPSSLIHDHYPAWLEKRHRNDGVNQKRFDRWKSALSGSPRTSGGGGEVRPGRCRCGNHPALLEDYGNEFRWEAAATKHRRSRTSSARTCPSASAAPIPRLKFRGAEDEARGGRRAKQGRGNDHKLFTNAQSALKRPIGKRTTLTMHWAVAEPRIPRVLLLRRLQQAALYREDSATS